MIQNELIASEKLKHNILLRKIIENLFVLGLLFPLLTSCMANMKQPVSPVVTQGTHHEEGLSNASFSVDELCKKFLDGLAAKDSKALVSLALTQEEFKTYYWPYTEWSRPEVRMPFDFYWGNHHQKSVVALSNMLAASGGKQLDFLSVHFTKETVTYQDAKIHVAPLLTVRDEEGKEWDLKFFGAVFELYGKYKIFSFN